jgi:hypothetical protein
MFYQLDPELNPTVLMRVVLMTLLLFCNLDKNVLPEYYASISISISIRLNLASWCLHSPVLKSLTRLPHPVGQK